jgi:predicted lysophospholipase L1 biosynthesis ABC-type transport system permease subunit
VAIVTGLVLSFFFTRPLAGMLYGISPAEPVVLATVVAIVFVVATLAALIPARPAALVEPMQVLRQGWPPGPVPHAVRMSQLRKSSPLCCASARPIPISDN